MHFRLAQAEDSTIVAAILAAAASRLREGGMALWSAEEVSEAAVAPHVLERLYHIGSVGAEPVGVFRLQFQDSVFWPEIAEGTSAYLHKLAVLPERKGQGLAHLLLHHAVRLTREKGLRFLRLDCMGGRPKLRTVYESFGFRHHSQKVLWGQPFDRYEFDVEAADV